MYDPYVLNVTRYFDKAVIVNIPETTKTDIRKLVEKIVEAKATELNHRIDNNAEFKRFYNGLLGEAALELILSKDIIDWEAGDSQTYDQPDIPGYNIGIKTVEYGKYPIIPKVNGYAQIICVIAPTEQEQVYICGLATKELLNSAQNDDLIIDPYLKAKGTKTAFTGFKDLKPIVSLESLEEYKK